MALLASPASVPVAAGFPSEPFVGGSLVPRTVDRLGEPLGPNGDAAEPGSDGCATWLPVVTSRLVLPHERCFFRARRSHVCETLQLCWERGLLLAAVPAERAAPGVTAPLGMEALGLSQQQQL